MIILWGYNILWWRKNECWSLNLRMGKLSLGESIVAFSFDLNWLILTVGTPHHEPKAKLWVS